MPLFIKKKDPYNIVGTPSQFGIELKLFATVCLINFILTNPFKAIIYTSIFIGSFFIVQYLINKINYTIKQHIKSTPIKLTKEQLKKYPIIIQHTPPKGINSAEAGVLFNGRAEVSDALSLIYQRENKGYIKIKKSNKHFNNTGKESNKIILQKICNIPDNHPRYEILFFLHIFGGENSIEIDTSSNLFHFFSLNELEIYCIRQGRVIEDIQKNSTLLGTFSTTLGALMSVFLIVSRFGFRTGALYPIIPNFTAQIIITLTILFLIIIIGGISFKGKKLKATDKGAKIISQIIGYRNFIKACDSSKIKTLLKSDSLFIDNTLPYAVAFGLDTQFIKSITPNEIDLDMDNGFYDKDLQNIYNIFKKIFK